LLTNKYWLVNKQIAQVRGQATMTTRKEPSPSPKTQVERRHEAEQRLLDAAAELIGEIGPAAVTLANIGERAGYSRGLATHHFGSKGAMMARLVDNVADQFHMAIFVERPAGSAMDELLALLDTYFQTVRNLKPVNRARLVLWADAVASPSPDVRPAMIAADRQFRAELVDGITRGVDAGDFPSTVDPAGLATVVIAMLRGVALESLLDDQIDLDACRSEIETLLTTRLRPAENRSTHQQKETLP
jgi:AcrR family transcriptional regulator